MFETEILGDTLSVSIVNLDTGRLKLTKQVDLLEHLKTCRELDQTNRVIDNFLEFMDLVTPQHFSKSDSASLRTEIQNAELADGVLGDFAKVADPLSPIDLEALERSYPLSSRLMKAERTRSMQKGTASPTEEMTSFYERYKHLCHKTVQEAVEKAIRALDLPLFFRLMNEVLAAV